VCGEGISTWDLLAATPAGTPPQPKFLEAVLAALKEVGNFQECRFPTRPFDV
jgi:hypothetical protein